MKAIMVMYDSLCKDVLGPYGGPCITPNFDRLARRAVRYDRFYVGSMPCMPARRELHIGRYNFLHRGWGPIEPYDDSMPELLKNHGVYTHLVTDHYHYFEDGGCTYHNRYSSWEGIRGQEGDLWKGRVKDPDTSGAEVSHGRGARLSNYESWRQDWINRTYADCEEKMPQSQTFLAGIDFIEKNHGEDQWFLQIETFDPHEPFFTQEQYKALYAHRYEGGRFDWAPYGPVRESKELSEHLRAEYYALVSMCDAKLGMVLDAMDRHQMWEDTMLIVNTDHGFLLGEHEWWAKGTAPLYNEIANTPFFLYDPRCRKTGVCGELAQTIDIAPTLLDYFHVEIPEDMQGRPLWNTYAENRPIHRAVLFGYYGAAIHVTDGRYVYARAPRDNQQNYEYTLMPTNLKSRFPVSQLAEAKLSQGFGFTKGARVLKIPSRSNYIKFHPPIDMLFHLEEDPGQQKNLGDEELEARYANQMIRLMKESEAPKEQFARMALPEEGEVTADMIREQRIVDRDYYRKANPLPGVWTESADVLLAALLPLFSQEQRQRYLDGLERIAAGAPERNVELLKAYNRSFAEEVGSEKLDFDMHVTEAYIPADGKRRDAGIERERRGEDL